MSHTNRELVKYFISVKLASKGYSWNQLASLDGSPTEVNHIHSGINGEANGAASGNSLPGIQDVIEIDAVKQAMQEAGNEFELRYRMAFNDLTSQLHITPSTAYQSFEQVVNELFRDGVNWGRIVAFFSFGGALCVECVEKEMGLLVVRIAEWMTTYLNNNLDPWIRDHGGWGVFGSLYGHNAAAEVRKSQELFKWVLTGASVAAGVLLVSYLAHRR
ncbi:bcl-2-like protein 1 [Protopterus annectens]|uniref:bcl-2-like protein 1 n=1 Tax=Protopterus annectens TaxID=7888 RepID=UPI001CFB4415|nr:bcl-2-like protein 1 [Protopterus annectens]XP_043946264.1 bcl-2-like protein 1 [Protopterus annectens]XP_043946265.1 bcl-2-like protein 1 [Protopterus annectens]